LVENLIVFKFGGSVLENSDSIAKAANLIRSEQLKGSKVVVVVSALRGVTNTLLDTAKKLNPCVSGMELDDVLAMGERTSARLFATALAGFGLKTQIIDPQGPLWPIITDENHLDANPLMDETQRLARQNLLPLLEDGIVPVVCGFVGRSGKGEITTMGRGGSDTTATVLGSCLNANEIVLVKDVAGVFSSDPDKVNDSVPIELLDAEEAQTLSAGGGKFLHVKALRFKKHGSGRVRIASLDGNQMGTIISGDIPELSVTVSQDPVTMITLVGQKFSDGRGVQLIVDNIRSLGGKVTSLTLEERSSVVYIEGGSQIVESMHEILVKGGMAKAIAYFDDLASVVVKGGDLETSPGMIQRVTQPLAREKINVFGLVTVSSSIKIFVKKQDTARAVELLKNALLVTNITR
jgi:aspartate kinase